jgi:hypothetical protein
MQLSPSAGKEVSFFRDYKYTHFLFYLHHLGAKKTQIVVNFSPL